MYRKKDNHWTIDDFILPFDGALAADNRWVIKARLIPWDDIEGDYSDLFPSGTGNVAKPARVAFGALVIKDTLGLTDEETGIRISGPRLGRPPKEPDPAVIKQACQDARDRNCSEGFSCF